RGGCTTLRAAFAAQRLRRRAHLPAELRRRKSNQIKAQCHSPLDPLLTDEQWLRIARRLEVTERELQIVTLVCEDQHEKTIAARLEISLHTVHAHLRHLYGKLGVESRAGLVSRVFREYLADAQQDQPALPRLMSPRSRRKAA
ncbi:MAG: helix-turn-helix domain-containing protein, partial [Thermoguttaceae bacterium]